jgi:hypothetical protein
VQQHHSFALAILDSVSLAAAKQQRDSKSDGVDVPQSVSLNNAHDVLFAVAIRVWHFLPHSIEYFLGSNGVLS